MSANGQLNGSKNSELLSPKKSRSRSPASANDVNENNHD